jgi:hypothetical protein
MKTLRKTSTLLTMAFVCSCLVGFLARSQGPTPVARRPFVSHEREEKRGIGGEVHWALEYIVAYRGDGSYSIRFTTQSPTGEAGWHVEILDVAASRSMFVEAFTKSVITFRLTEAEARRMAKIKMACQDPDVSEQLSQKLSKPSRMRGYDVRGISRKDSRVTIWSWVAPDLDCYAFAETQSFSNGSRNERWVEQIAVGDPPASLFQAPVDFTERSPAETEALFRAKYNGAPLFGDPALQRVEDRYRKGRR